MSKLDIAVRLAAIISITTGIAGVVVQVRTTGLDVDSAIAGAFIGVVLTGVVVVAATELIRRRNRAWLAGSEAAEARRQAEQRLAETRRQLRSG